MDLDIIKLKKTNKLALLLGLFIGDGCLPVSHNGDGNRIYPIRFYNTNKVYVKLFSDLFFDLFQIKGTVRGRIRENKKILWEFEKYSVYLYKLINSELEVPSGKKASQVWIPSFIRNGTLKIKKSFFLGLFISDGGLKKDGSIIFHSASQRLMFDLRKLIHSIWGFERDVKSYLQKDKYLSYQLTLKKEQVSIITKQMPLSHNSVLRRLSER